MNMQFKIEKNVPMPQHWRRKKGEELFPLSKMEIGDSILVPRRDNKSWAFLFAYIQKFQAKNPGIKFSTREVDDGESRRVWRIE